MTGTAFNRDDMGDRVSCVNDVERPLVELLEQALPLPVLRPNGRSYIGVVEQPAVGIGASGSTGVSLNSLPGNRQPTFVAGPAPRPARRPPRRAARRGRVHAGHERWLMWRSRATF
jgi:hypothetical protein